jgi:hypothetical protein
MQRCCQRGLRAAVEVRYWICQGVQRQAKIGLEWGNVGTSAVRRNRADRTSAPSGF